MKNSQYFYIHGWMINELELDSKEMIAYAMIYSYYRSGLETHASLKYFADVMHCSERTVSTVLSGLGKKGLISKVLVRGRDGRNRNIYRINYQILADKGIMTTEDNNKKAEKPENFTSYNEKISEDAGKNCIRTPEKISANNTNIYNNNFDNISSPSNLSETVKYEEKKEEKELTKKMSYQEVLKEIGISESRISLFKLNSEKDIKKMSQLVREGETCTIPYSFKGNKKAIETALKYMTCYSYNIDQGDKIHYCDNADMIISCMAELASETTKIKGQPVKYCDVIDRLNEINQDGRGLEDWINTFPIFWKKILKEKEQNGEEIRYKKPFMKACIWDYMNRPYGLW